MKKLPIYILTFAIFISAFALTSTAEYNEDNYKDIADWENGESAVVLHNYERINELTAEEKHAYWKAHQGMTHEEIVEYELAQAEDDEYVPFYIIFEDDIAYDTTSFCKTAQEFIDNNLENIKCSKASVLPEWLSDETKECLIVKIKKSAFDEVVSYKSVKACYFPFPAPLPEYDGLLGDIDQSGKVTVKDAIVFVQRIAGHKFPPRYDKSEYDINRDYLENILDAIEIAKMVTDQ